MADKPKPTEQELMEAFYKEYTDLCKKHGYVISVSPAFKAMADTGTFNVVLQTSVGKLQNEATNV